MTNAQLISAMRRHGRNYVDARDPETFLGVRIRSRQHCEHCDGERSHLVREDRLRGLVCPPCDSSLDEMLTEGTYARAKEQR